MGDATCSLDECSEPAAHAGMCKRDYRLSLKARKERLAAENPDAFPRCSVDGCGRLTRANGMCNKHNENVRRNGTPTARHELSVEARLAEVGWTTTTTGCMEWNGNRNEAGYGRWRGYRVHRLVVEIRDGVKLADDILVRHKCDNPPCGNPDHLEVGTHADNTADMMERGRYSTHGRTECKRGHDLTVSDAFVASYATNTCRLCFKETQRRYLARKRDAAANQAA